MSNAPDEWGVNPDTGDVCDADGTPGMGDLNDAPQK